jgi:general secretion pathway protein G
MNVAALVIGIAVAGLVVIAIIGILAAIAVPNLLTAMQRSKQKRTMADMRTLATALDAYGTDHEQEEYPPGEYAASLAPHLQPAYVKALPGVDGWGTGIRYSPLPNRGYVLVSAGSDKTFEESDPSTKRETSSFDCDIVFSNGEFVQYPEHATMGGR